MSGDAFLCLGGSSYGVVEASIAKELLMTGVPFLSDQACPCVTTDIKIDKNDLALKNAKC